MAYRSLSAALRVTSLLKQPLRQQSLRNGCSVCNPLVPYLEKPSIVFSCQALMHHWGAIPIVAITAFGFTCELLCILRIACTRDDVFYTKDSAAYLHTETRKGYPPPIRKLRTYNQTYKTPPGLIAALQGDAEACDGKK